MYLPTIVLFACVCVLASAQEPPPPDNGRQEPPPPDNGRQEPPPPDNGREALEALVDHLSRQEPPPPDNGRRAWSSRQEPPPPDNGREALEALVDHLSRQEHPPDTGRGGPKDVIPNYVLYRRVSDPDLPPEYQSRQEVPPPDDDLEDRLEVYQGHSIEPFSGRRFNTIGFIKKIIKVLPQVIGD